MSTHMMKHPALPKRTAAVLAVALAAGIGVTLSAGPASAAVYSSCTISGCDDAATAVQTWDSLGLPTSRGWYDLSDGNCDYAGGEYYNNDGQLPNGDTYYEYDVYERACGAHRDAYRIVHDIDTDTWYYSPDHYSDFYQMS
ncbi:MAG TPA: ribonuclease domain-containing protein [Actinospica sp.]|nr:ribonuclease domain-containing protein [Actinospica sp.]